MPLVNMWCAQTVSPRTADRQAGDGDHLVAENGLTREDRQDVRNDAHGRKHHDVDGRVGVEPEQVLPQDRIAAGLARRRTSVPARRSKQEQDQPGGQRGRGRRAPGLAVARMPQTNSGRRQNGHTRGPHREDRVVTKLIAPRMDEVPRMMMADRPEASRPSGAAHRRAARTPSNPASAAPDEEPGRASAARR